MRNPQAAITNFADVPEGLRVYEASDGGPGFMETLLTRPWDLCSRVTDAHLAVLDDPGRRLPRLRDDGLRLLLAARAGRHPPAGPIAHGPARALKAPLNKMV